MRSEAAKKRSVCKYTNRGTTPPASLAPYAAYATGASCSRHRPCSLTPPPFSSSSSDKADSGRVISPDDPVEEERALAEALAQMATEATAQQAAEEADRLAVLHAVKAFQERETACTQRLAEAACIPPSVPLLGHRHRLTRSPALR
jgi:hypothetical protein